MWTAEHEERRRSPRFTVAADVSAATRTERPVLGGLTINASTEGLLVAFPGPAIPLNPGDRCLLSLQLSDGALHLVAVVRRKEAGDDGRQYVGLECEEVGDFEVERLIDHSRREARCGSGPAHPPSAR